MDYDLALWVECDTLHYAMGSANVTEAAPADDDSLPNEELILTASASPILAVIVLDFLGLALSDW